MAFILASCNKELSISDFEDDFKEYKSEIRVEAILNASNFEKSIIRVDKTLLVTDTSYFNGIDDNGDWVSFSDDNNNGIWDEGEALNDDVGVLTPSLGGPIWVGRGNGIPDAGEPHIDDFAEILPRIHDSTLVSVELHEKISGNLVAEFEWKSVADSFEVKQRGSHADNEIPQVYVYTYGAYMPKSEYANVSIQFGTEYEFKFETVSNDIIHGSTVPFPPASELSGDSTFWRDDTLVIPQNSDGLIQWTTVPECNVNAVTIDNITKIDSIENIGEVNFPSIELNDDGRSLYKFYTILMEPGLYRMEIYTLDEHYATYSTSALELNDVEMSNLRNQDEKVILGFAGSVSYTNYYFRIE